MNHILPVLFISISAASLFLCLFMFLQNTRSGVNITFSAICACMAVWSFGFSIAIKAPTLYECMLGRRIAAFGWIPLFGLIVHFGLLMLKEKGIHVKSWIYALIYVPVLISLYHFSLSASMVAKQYTMVHTAYGWVNVAVNNGWDYFLYAYLAVSLMAVFYILKRWGANADDITESKQAKWISIALAAAVLLASADLFINTLLPTAYVPQMAPLVFFIPLAVISFCMNKFRFCRKHKTNDMEAVLSNNNKKMTYNYFSFAFAAGGFICFISLYIFKASSSVLGVLPICLPLFLLSIGLQWITRLPVKKSVLEHIYAVTVSISIPAITFVFINSGSTTIWAFPFIMLIFSMVFRRRVVLLCTAASFFITQIIVWVLNPQSLAIINSGSYSGRLGIFAIAVWVAFYAHKAYVLRLTENEEQLRREKLISDISFEIAGTTRKNEEKRVSSLLMHIGTFYGADSVRFIPCPKDASDSYRPYCWIRGEASGLLTETTHINHSDIADPCDMAVYANGKLYPVGKHAAVEKITREGIGSLISFPITVKDMVIGHLRLETLSAAMTWREDHLDLMKILSNIMADYMEKVRVESRVHFLAYYDNLTGLPNRALFKDRTEQAISLAQRSEKTIAVIFLDLDGFKSINDTMGHQGGDLLIREVASQLVKCLRKTDTVARFGGDEFVIMLNHLSDMANIEKIMRSVMNLFMQPFIVHGQEMFVTGSAGVAMYPIDGTDTESLIKSADIAMYHAKDKGKNQYILCSPHMREEIHLKMRLTNSMYRALERNELKVYYQPQVELSTGRIVGMEALLRWEHPEIGMVSPSVFIPLAEQSGLINTIGEWVLYEACRQNMLWKSLGLPRMRVAVNISVNQFRSPNLIGQVKNILEMTGLDPQDLELEITEGIAIKEAGYIISVLNELKRLNVCISIDDFGTEYSSLSRLKMLPVDRIKMDIQFVREIEHSDKDKAISQVIINLAKSLGMKVIAEGVETQGQLDFLEQQKCDEVQGYYYYLPMPASDVENVIRAHKNKISDNAVLTPQSIGSVIL